jgi:hypothetical protein
MENVRRIANYLIVNSSSLHDIGLFNGKMGISVFFFHYARFVKEEIYAGFAKLLLEQVMDDITTYTPVNLQDGLCGIGWGIEYLVQEGFIKADTDELFAELDMQVMSVDVSRISDYSLATGLKGIVHYWLSRCRNQKDNGYPFDRQYRSHLEDTLKEYKAGLTDPFRQSHVLHIPDIIRNNTPFTGISEDVSLGLNNGLAGIGLKEITG